ncbi:MAG TPA: ABC transporter permease [Syntrophaceae bacterium]|jgi:phospholipid/cholesterol/gamma-HCH transport system permease protein|nr:ABC transporter permease [Syntrophaceae bacterium]
MAFIASRRNKNKNDKNEKPGLPVLRFFAFVGKTVIAWVDNMGAAAVFLWLALWQIFRRKQFAKTVTQIYYIGARSITIIMLVSLFTGMVLGLQAHHALTKFGAAGAVGSLVALSLIMELGPVLTAIMITARAGSAIAAEIGIQRISEQIDALHTMRINPMRYIVSPKISAAIISFPLLTAVFDLVGILGGYISSVLLLGLNPGVYWHSAKVYVEMADITNGFIKSIVFAVIVATVCCYQGYFAHMRRDSHGAQAVGLATTSAVVISCVLILVSDYVVTSLLL